MQLNTAVVDRSWQPLFQTALKQMNPEYLKNLEQSQEWLPGHQQIFNAFSLPLTQVNYILFGESPYPRAASANGYAFWDGAVENLWSDTGLSKTVNRATSLRNLLKMLLIADDLLPLTDTSQPAIAAVAKNNLVQTAQELFKSFTNRGILLLNASLVLTDAQVGKDAKAWLPFINYLLAGIHQQYPKIELILFGRIAEAIDSLSGAAGFPRFYAEHPYNLSFITNPAVIKLFTPLKLLSNTL